MQTTAWHLCYSDHRDCSVSEHTELSSFWTPEYFTVWTHPGVKAAPGSTHSAVSQSDRLSSFISLIEVEGHWYLICIFLYLPCSCPLLFFFFFFLLSFFSYFTSFSKEIMIQVLVSSVNRTILVWREMNVCQEIGVRGKSPGTGCGGRLGLPGVTPGSSASPTLGLYLVQGGVCTTQRGTWPVFARRTRDHVVAPWHRVILEVSSSLDINLGSDPLGSRIHEPYAPLWTSGSSAVKWE